MKRMSRNKPRLHWIRGLMIFRFPAKVWERFIWSMDPRSTRLLLIICPLGSRKEKFLDFWASMELVRPLPSRCWLDRSPQLLVKVTSKDWRLVIMLIKSEKILDIVHNLMLSLKIWPSLNNLNFSTTSNLCQLKIRKQLSTRRLMNLTLEIMLINCQELSQVVTKENSLLPWLWLEIQESSSLMNLQQVWILEPEDLCGKSSPE